MHAVSTNQIKIEAFWILTIIDIMKRTVLLRFVTNVLFNSFTFWFLKIILVSSSHFFWRSGVEIVRSFNHWSLLNMFALSQLQLGVIARGRDVSLFIVSWAKESFFLEPSFFFILAYCLFLVLSI